MDSSDHIKKAKPDWSNRRKIVICNLRHCMFMMWACVIASVALAWFGKLDWNATLILGTAFVVTAGEGVLVVGSYVFGASWESAKFMDLLTALKPGVTVNETVEEKK